MCHSSKRSTSSQSENPVVHRECTGERPNKGMNRSAQASLRSLFSTLVASLLGAPLLPALGV